MADVQDETDALVWECGLHTNAWNGHDARCRQVPRQPEPDRYVVAGPGGFTESIPKHHVETLVNLGLIEHERDDYVIQDAQGRGVGALHHFYREARRG